jgi:hypothetical protein
LIIDEYCTITRLYYEKQSEIGLSNALLQKIADDKKILLS